MQDEITESAKAVQEVAKTTRAGIEASERLGGFVSMIINEPLENVVGILTDRLRFMRAERQLRLVDRWREIVKERKIEGPLRIVTPKVALPIIESASLEENDELQDLWANLLASAVDPQFEGLIRAAYIDIIKQLEVVDVHILNVVYESYKQWLEERLREKIVDDYYFSPLNHAVGKIDITERLGISFAAYENSVDNLMRVRCLASYVADETIDTEVNTVPNYAAVTVDYRYEFVCITLLGVSFVEACIGSGLPGGDS
jgi:hypothetical protein